MSQIQDQPGTTTLPSPGTYTVDPLHSSIGFVARHLVASKVRGTFTEFEGTIEIGAAPEESKVSATAKVQSVTTHQEQRDAHLRTPDFFDAEHFPEATLVSKRITASGDAHYELVTDLTIRGVTKEVVFDLEFLGTGPGMAPGTESVGFEATATIDRRDFNVSFNGTLENGSFVVSNKVTIELAVEATKQG